MPWKRWGVHVNFWGIEKPTRCWAYEGLPDAAMAPGKPNQGVELELYQHSMMSVEFRKPISGSFRPVDFSGNPDHSRCASMWGLSQRPGDAVVRGLASLVCLLLISGCGSATGGDDGELPRGWTELPPGPYDDALISTLSFWAGDRLVVTGGYTTDRDSVTFSAATYVFDVEANSWTEGSDLVLPGLDGIIAGDGIWTGTQWTGWLVGCRSGALLEEQPLNNCDQVPLIGRWSPDQGWTSAPMPEGSIGPDDYLLAIAGQLGSEVVIATQTGPIFVHDEAVASLRSAPWPAGAEPYDPHAACVVGDSIITISSSAGQLTEQDVNDQLLQRILGNTVLADGSLDRQFPVLDLPTPPTFPFCQQGVGLYVDGVTFSLPLRIVHADGQRELPLAPTIGTGDMSQPLANVNSLWIDVGDGIASLNSLGMSSFYLRSSDGATTALQPVPNLTSPAIWTGQAILAQFQDAPARWFTFVPGPWEDAGELPPPIIE